MANFDIIYKIATDLSGLQKGVDDTAKATTEIDKKMSGLQSSVANVGKTLAGVFGAAAIGSAIKGLVTDVIDLGGQLADMSAKTGISLKGLQLLKVAAEQNGVSLDQVASAANKLGINLGGGGKDVVSAVNRLGLSLADLKKGDPESNMFAIAKAMDGIQNPAERAQIAMSLFGKAGLELLPVLNGQFSESAAAAERLGIVIGDDVLNAADVFGDQMTVLKASMMKFTAEGLAPMLPGLLKGAELFVAFASGAIKFGRAIVDSVIGGVLKATEILYGFAAIVADISDHIPILGKALGGAGFSFAEMKKKAQEAADQSKAFNEATDRSAKGLDAHSASTKKALPIIGEWGKGETEAAAAAKKHAEELERLVDLNQQLGLAGYKQLLADQKKYWDEIHDAATRTGERLKANGLLTIHNKEQMAAWAAQMGTGLSFSVDVLSKVGTTVTEVAPKITNLGVLVQQSLVSTFKGIPSTLVSALTGGGGIGGAVKAIGTQIGTGLGQSISDSLAGSAAKNIGGGLDKFLKSGLGQVVSAAIPVVGSLLGPAISGLGKLFGFGESAAEKALKEAKKLRDSFVSSAGGMDVLNARATAAGTTLLRVLNAKTPEAYKAAIDDLNAAFAFQDQAMKTLDDTVAKYGFTLAEVPPKFREGKLHEQFLELYQDQQVLRAGGFEFDAILVKQKDSFLELIKTSIATGTAIPIQLKPAVDRLREMGLLTNENGEELEGLGKLTFAETLDQKFTTLIDTINRLADAISRGVGGALANVAATAEAAGNAIRDIPAPSGLGFGDPGDPASYGSRGGIVGAGGIRYLGSGGPIFAPRGIDTVPAMLSVGEGVLSRDGMEALGELNRGESPKVVSMAQFLAAQERTNTSLAGLRRDLATTIPTMVASAARHGSQTSPRRRR